MRPDAADNRSLAERVAARLRALRDEHSDAQVTTELVRFDDSVAIVRAAIVLPGGGSASGYGGSSAPGHEAVEEAETRALSRALTVLGYGGEARVASASAGAGQRAPEPSVEHRPPAAEPAATPAAEPAPRAATAQRAPARPAASAASSAQPASKPVAATADEPPLEDYSWTAFWNWARKLGYQNKPAVEELIGQSITSLSPAQVRDLMREKTGAV